MADQRIPVGGDGNFRVLEDVAGAGTGRVRDEVEVSGEMIELLRELLTEVRAVRRGLELAIEADLMEGVA